MPIGFHDSAWANGSSIKAEREKKGWSRDYVVESSKRSFSERTLQRAEKSQRISIEILGKIATTLGLDLAAVILDVAPIPTSSDHFSIHHWDDEAEDLVHIPLTISLAIEKITGSKVSISRLDDGFASFSFELEIHALETKLRYELYGNFADFERIVSRVVRNEDVVVLDVMNQTGTGRFTSDGLEGASKIDRLAKRDNVAFLTAFPDIVEKSGAPFQDIAVFSKADMDGFIDFLIERFKV